MKGGIFDRPECCNQPCECPVCLENKPLIKLNCNHYVCLDDIKNIINSNPRRLQICPICRELITSYGCNGNITNIANNQQPNTDDWDNMTDEDRFYNEMQYIHENFGGRRKINRTRKHINKRKIHKKRKTKHIRKNTKKSKKNKKSDL
jgi:hypothetical protein